MADLRRPGVIVHSISDQVPEGLDGRLMESIQAWKNAKYVDDLRRNVRRGMRHTAVTFHAWMARIPPFGYLRQPVEVGHRRDGSPHTISRLIIDPEKAPLVRRAFEMRSQGAVGDEIRAATGLHPYRREYTRMLRNEIYTGAYVLSDGTRVENFCEPIISRELWDAVQRVNAGRRSRAGVNHPRIVRSSYLLTGIVYCARCGNRMNGSSAHGRGGAYRYYRCSGSDDGTCGARGIPIGGLEDAVLGSLRAEAVNPVEIARLAADVLTANAARSSSGRIALDQARAELAETQARARRLVTAIADAGHSHTMLDQLAEIEERESDLLRRIAALEAELAPRGAVDLEVLQRQAEKVLDTAVRAELQEIMRSFVARVVAERTAAGEIVVEIMYKLPG